MAKIKKIVRSNPLSTFSQVAPQGSAAIWQGFSQALDSAYQQALPGVMQEEQRKGAENATRAAMSRLGARSTSDAGLYADAIASIESAGSGGYSAIGPTTKSGDKAYGRYQVMGSNIPAWTEKWLGQKLTPEEFLANPDAQDKVFNGQFGSYVDKYGNPQDAASAWFTGRPRSTGSAAKDILGTSGSDYVSKFDSALGAVTAERDAKGQITTATKSGGDIESLTYSPYSGPILRAHDAAAGVAYTSEIMNRASTDILDIANKFPNDPDGFSTAAQAYIDQIAADSPPEFRADIRQSLSTAATRRTAGIMSDKQADIRQRAANSSSAMVSRLQKEYAELRAVGDDEGALAVVQELDGVLKVRERLPGLSWTPEQSQNVLAKAEAMAGAVFEKNRTTATKEAKTTLDTIIAAAKSGMTAEGEDILKSDWVRAALPELSKEAASFVALRDNMPDFMKLPPQAQAEIVKEMRADKVGAKWEIGIVDAAEKTMKESQAAWEADPISRARDVLSNKPPELPSFGPDSAKGFVEALQARGEYAKSLFDNGYVEQPVYFSVAEAESLSALLGKDTDPAIRAAAASAIVAGFGADAVAVFGELKADKVTMMSGKLMAIGGDSNLATEALAGQQMLSEGIVQVPSKSDQISAISTDISDAFVGIPNAVEAQGEVMALAKSLYAANAQGIEPSSDEAKTLMEESIQRALGQKENRRGKKTGGVQEVAGNSVLLPVGVSGKDANAALEKAFRKKLPDGAMAATAAAIFGGHDLELAQQEVWIGASAGGAAPLIDSSFVRNENIRLVSIGGNNYRMEVVLPSGVSFNVEDTDGNVFFFDLPKLIEAMK
jgi:hypothetical protein